MLQLSEEAASSKVESIDKSEEITWLLKIGHIYYLISSNSHIDYPLVLAYFRNCDESVYNRITKIELINGPIFESVMNKWKLLDDFHEEKVKEYIKLLSEHEKTFHRHFKNFGSVSILLHDVAHAYTTFQ